MTEKDELREKYRELNRRNPFVRHNHIEVTEIERDRAVLQLVIRPESRNVYGLVHGGWGHLLFNMLTLYFFGTVVEQYFQVAFGHTPGIILYVVLYVSAIAVSTIGDLVKYKDAPGYNAVGASGAVSAVLFASILFEPKMGIYIYLIPIPVPGYIFAPLYLLYCWYMAKRNMDNIGHTAHFWGAVYGLVFPLIFRPDIFHHFLSQLGL